MKPYPRARHLTAGTAPAASGDAAGAVCRMNFNALWDYIDAIAGSPAGVGQQEAAAIRGVIDLYRAASELTATTGESEGLSHSRIHLRIRDIK